MTERNLSFAAVGLAHGHIVQMCEGLIGAGARLKYICDGDRGAETLFAAKFPGATIAPFDQILADEEVGLVATAAVPGRRCGIGVRAMEAGKHFFSAKAPVVSSEQLRMLRETAARTGRKVFVYYSERVASEAAVFAEKLIAAGKIGRVINVVILAPHKLGKRPDWFFSREDTGGILIDIGSHQFEQFLTYTGNGRAEIVASSVANFAHGEHPGFDDFGDAFLRGENGATGYIRVDWFTPDSLPVFGDGKVVIEGTEGYIELRKYIDVGGTETETILLSTREKTEKFSVAGKVEKPFFPAVLRDCKEGTETAMPAEHAFYTMELAIRAQECAKRL